MALVLAIQHWRPYLIGRKFTVCANHRNLRHLLQQQTSTPAQQYWLSKLMEYNFLIEYKVGCTNRATYGLSRRVEEAEVFAISIPQWADWELITHEVL